MSNLKKSINFKALENELDEALKADELYKLQNDAKFRAIEQRVPTYDHFSDMVGLFRYQRNNLFSHNLRL